MRCCVSENRPATPAGVKRQLRQESGFGCSFCGHPFVQYHHIIPWREDQHFRPEDMMVVCPNCHHLCTTDAISQREQRASKNRPKNVADGFVRGRLYVNNKEPFVWIGGGKAVNTPELIRVGGIPILRVIFDPKDGRALVSARMYDANGIPFAVVENNEWVVSIPKIWDLEVFPRSAKISEKPQEISLSVRTQDDGVRLTGVWNIGSERIEFGSERIAYGNTSMVAPTFTNCRTLLELRAPENFGKLPGLGGMPWRKK